MSDFHSQAENVFTTLEAILNEAGATLAHVASLSSFQRQQVRGTGLGGCSKSDAIRAKAVMGTSIKDATGEKIGHVEDIVLDKLSNNIVFAIVGFRFPGANLFWVQSMTRAGYIRGSVMAEGTFIART